MTTHGIRGSSDRSVLVLTSLAGGPKHGYALIKDIEEFAGVEQKVGRNDVPLGDLHDDLGCPSWVTGGTLRTRSDTSLHHADGGVVVLRDVVDCHRGACPVRGESTGFDDHRADAKERRLGGQTARETVDRELGRLIARDTW